MPFLQALANANLSHHDVRHLPTVVPSPSTFERFRLLEVACEGAGRDAQCLEAKLVLRIFGEAETVAVGLFAGS